MLSMLYWEILTNSSTHQTPHHIPPKAGYTKPHNHQKYTTLPPETQIPPSHQPPPRHLRHPHLPARPRLPTHRPPRTRRPNPRIRLSTHRRPRTRPLNPRIRYLRLQPRPRRCTQRCRPRRTSIRPQDARRVVRQGMLLLAVYKTREPEQRRENDACDAVLWEGLGERVCGYLARVARGAGGGIGPGGGELGEEVCWVGGAGVCAGGAGGAGRWL